MTIINIPSDINDAIILEMTTKIQKEIHFEAKIPPSEPAWLLRLKQVPFLIKFMKDVDITGSVWLDLEETVHATKHSIHTVHAVGQAIHGGAIAMTAIDFIRIPIMYIGAFILRGKVPFTLSNNAKWLYAGVLLALAISALLVPVAAPYIAIAAASLVFTASVATLGKNIFERLRLRKKLKKVLADLQEYEKELRAIQTEAKRLEELYGQASENEILNIDQAITTLVDDYNTYSTWMQELTDKEYRLEQEKKSLGLMSSVDAGAALALASLSLVGVIILFFFPPIGIGILAATATVGIAYMVARITVPLLKKGFLSLMKRIKPLKKEAEIDDLVEKYSPDSPKAIIKSEAKILKKLKNTISADGRVTSNPIKASEDAQPTTSSPATIKTLSEENEDSEREGEGKPPVWPH